MTGTPDLRVRVAGVALPNPLVLASGVLGVSASSMAFAVRHGAGAVTTKSCSLAPRAGHKPPVVAPFAHGLLNAVGLSNPGAEEMSEEIRAFRARCPAPVFASVFGASPEEFAAVTREVVAAGPDLVEVNVSCPNVASEFGRPFAADPVATAEVTRAVKAAAGAVPVSVKLSLACPSIPLMARTCQEAGADALTLVNTVGPGMLVDVRTRRPLLTNRVGGLSGPAILPLAVRAVWEARQAVDLPIIGTGGVETAEDVLQLVLAGADAVGVGTAVWRRGVEVFDAVNRDLEVFLEQEGIPRLADMKGGLHA